MHMHVDKCRPHSVWLCFVYFCMPHINFAVAVAAAVPSYLRASVIEQIRIGSFVCIYTINASLRLTYFIGGQTQHVIMMVVALVMLVMLMVLLLLNSVDATLPYSTLATGDYTQHKSHSNFQWKMIYKYICQHLNLHRVHTDDTVFKLHFHTAKKNKQSAFLFCFSLGHGDFCMQH